MATGIRDKVAILGMGCSRFGERFEMDASDLMVEAYTEAAADAGIETKQIDAAWLATGAAEYHVGFSAIPLATTLRLPMIPTTRVENFSVIMRQPTTASATPSQPSPRGASAMIRRLLSHGMKLG